MAGRGLLLFLAALWTVGFLAHGLDAPHISRSFLHLLHLVFHEAGHVVFSPFGHFVMVLGGTLMQLLVPAALLAAFLLQNRQPFPAALMLWWGGSSLVDVAPYVADARALALPLLDGRTGAEVEGHDWEYILTALGWLRYDVLLGRLAFGLGCALMVLALAWGGYVLALQARRPA